MYTGKAVVVRDEEGLNSRVNTAREHLTPSQLTDRPPEALKRLGKHMNFFVIFQEV